MNKRRFTFCNGKNKTDHFRFDPKQIPFQTGQELKIQNYNFNQKIILKLYQYRINNNFNTLFFLELSKSIVFAQIGRDS